MKLKAGDLFPTKTLRPVSGKELHVPDSGSLTHLQFRRFVGCPICNMHIGQMMKRAEEIKSAGIHEVIFFHSREEEMQLLQQGVPFDLVADAEKVLVGPLTNWLKHPPEFDPEGWALPLYGEF